MKTFKQETLILIDRTYVDFRGCDYVLNNKIDDEGYDIEEDGVLHIQLLPTGIKQVIQNLRYGKYSRGESQKTIDHLVEFIKDDLKGALTITQIDDPDTYQDIMFDIVLNEEGEDERKGRLYIKELWDYLAEHKEDIFCGSDDLNLTKYRGVIRRANKVSNYYLRGVKIND